MVWWATVVGQTIGIPNEVRYNSFSASLLNSSLEVIY